MKARLLNNELLEYKCSICNLVEWNGKAISLQLDHINGQRKDNRIENLRLLCPNCHSQTDTFCGKNIKGIKRKSPDQYTRYPCVKCNKLLQRYQNKLKLCPSCRKTEYGGKLTQKELDKCVLLCKNCHSEIHDKQFAKQREESKKRYCLWKDSRLKISVFQNLNFLNL